MKLPYLSRIPSCSQPTKFFPRHWDLAIPPLWCMGIVLVKLSVPKLKIGGSKAALSGHFFAVSRGAIDFFLNKAAKKNLSPIQAVLALELKALRPLPAPGSFPFAAVGRAVNLSMQLIYVIQIKTSCTNVIK